MRATGQINYVSLLDGPVEPISSTDFSSFVYDMEEGCARVFLKDRDMKVFITKSLDYDIMSIYILYQKTPTTLVSVMVNELGEKVVNVMTPWGISSSRFFGSSYACFLEGPQADFFDVFSSQKTRGLRTFLEIKKQEGGNILIYERQKEIKENLFSCDLI
ncbi:hypothetical protein H6776_02905 [Candidatus Nomurabacteria bacterium]|nr:hypothetical protein [Candidatus Nomurabacteria bacterium]